MPPATLDKMRCFYHPDYCFPLPAEHPFPMDKFWRAEAHLQEQLGARVDFVEPRPATMDQLRRVHTAAYLAKIRSADLDRTEVVKLGLPPGEALLARSRLEVGGTLAAFAAARADGLSCNLAGGTHHAFPDRGLGYCVLNDVAVAIRELLARPGPARVFVLDTDAHQGNGTNAIFHDNPHVFTYSIHVGKNYPACKTPGSLDVELPRYATGAVYQQQLEASLGPALRQFQPTFVAWIAGADIHEQDRFGQLKLSDQDIARRDHFVLDLLSTWRAPVALLYGGGYNLDRPHTARIHADTVIRAVQHFTR